MCHAYHFVPHIAIVWHFLFFLNSTFLKALTYPGATHLNLRSQTAKAFKQTLKSQIQPNRW
jgi:hypothetical protein